MASAMSKEDWAECGRRAHVADANPGVTRPDAPKEGTWQRKAWDHGYGCARVAAPAAAKRGPRTHTVDVGVLMLATHLANWKPAQVEHLRGLARDHNAEKNRARRGRLYRAIGRQLDKHGIRSPIPLI